MRRIHMPAKGFTLTELVIAIAILAILAAIAYPSYRGQVLRGNRTIARNQLVELAQKQEEQQIKRGAYATTFDRLVSIDQTTVYVDRDGGYAAALSSDSIYELAFQGTPSSSEYEIRATPVGNQTDDEDCAWLQIYSNGRRTAEDDGGTSNPDCWTR